MAVTMTANPTAATGNNVKPFAVRIIVKPKVEHNVKLNVKINVICNRACINSVYVKALSIF